MNKLQEQLQELEQRIEILENKQSKTYDYKNIITFTVKKVDSGLGFQLQFINYPNCLRNQELGYVYDIKITSTGMPDYDFNVLYLPGTYKDSDRQIVEIPFLDFHSFAEKLLKLLTEKYLKMKN